MSENIPAQKSILQLQEVGKVFHQSPEAPPTRVLSSVNLEVWSGQSLAIIGPSGSGKSTLLNLIGGLDTPTEGKVILDERDLSGVDEEEMAQLRNRTLGFVFQSHHLLPQCNVMENVLVPTLVPNTGMERQEDPEARAKRLLARVGLSDRLTHRPGQLSGGECQRVAVVRALINEPKILLADEPTGSLDGKNAEELADLLVELNREESVTTMVVTHSLDLASRMATVYRLQDGQLVQDRAQ
jgi:ABC-type lipoprotein export system ATPase subunit